MMSTSNVQAVSDARNQRRFNTVEPVPGLFAGVDVEILNVSEEGVQLRHGSFLKLGTRSTVKLQIPETCEPIAFTGRIVWSRLSTTLDRSGKFNYVSGLHLEDSEKSAGALGRLIRHGARPDLDSMDRKRKTVQQKAQRRMIPLPREPRLRLTADQILLIKEAREKLQADPEQAKQYYKQAKVLVSTHLEAEALALPYRQDVLAIWGYLNGHVEIEQVALVYDLTNRL